MIASGTVIEGYEFLEEIGEGGFAHVYKVLSLKYKMVFAAKIQSLCGPNSVIKFHTFQREITTLKQLDHPNIIRFYDHFIHKKHLFLIMEYCPNGSIEDMIKKDGPLSLRKIQEYSESIFSALEYVHSKGISHHDIKPANILIDQYGRAKIADFGISLHSHSTRSQAGSPGFLAPEIVANKKYDPMAADIWAASLSIYKMIEGHLPWTKAEKMEHILQNNLWDVPKNLPLDLSFILTHGIEVSPLLRATASEINKKISKEIEDSKNEINLRHLSTLSKNHLTHSLPLHNVYPIHHLQKSIWFTKSKMVRSQFTFSENSA